LGTEGPLPLEREFQRHVRWLNQESAMALAYAECQRSTPAIVSVTNTFIRQNNQRAKQGADEQVESHRQIDDEDPVYQFGFANVQSLAIWVAEQIQSWIEAGDWPEDICVIARQWDQLALIRALLQRVQIQTQELRPDIDLSKTMLATLLRRDLYTTYDRVFTSDESIATVFQEFFASIDHDANEPTVAELLDIAEHIDEQREVSIDDIQQRSPIATADILLALKEYDKGIPQRKNGAVAVSSMHSVKGLEFKRVIVLVDAVQSIQQDMQEERRLVYVAMTRAKDTLVLCSAADPNDFDSQYSNIYLDTGLITETLEVETDRAIESAFFRRATPRDVWLSFDRTKAQQPLIERMKEGDPLRISRGSYPRISLPTGQCIGSLAAGFSKELLARFGARSKELGSDIVSVYKIFHHVKLEQLTGEILEDHFVVLPEIKYILEDEQ
jgi:ATP-dependent DNA helicase RecQ